MNQRSFLRGLTWQNTRGYNPIVAAAEMWQRESQPEATVKWEALPWIEFEHRLLASLQGEAQPYDLVMLEHPWIGTLVEPGYLRPWDELAEPGYLEALRNRVVPPSYDRYLWNDRLYALLIDAACHAGLMRRDLVDRDTLPADWAGLREWAEARYDPPNVYPLVLSVSSVWATACFSR